MPYLQTLFDNFLYVTKRRDKSRDPENGWDSDVVPRAPSRGQDALAKSNEIKMFSL